MSRARRLGFFRQPSISDTSSRDSALALNDLHRCIGVVRYDIGQPCRFDSGALTTSILAISAHSHKVLYGDCTPHRSINVRALPAPRCNRHVTKRIWLFLQEQFPEHGVRDEELAINPPIPTSSRHTEDHPCKAATHRFLRRPQKKVRAWAATVDVSAGR